MSRGRFPEFGALVLVVLGTPSCDVRLYPLRAGSGQDSGAAVGVCYPALIGFGAMSDQGGEWDAGSTGMPTLLLDGGATGGGALDAGDEVTVDATKSGALAEFSMYASDKTPGPLTIIVKGIINIPPPPDGGSSDLEKIRISSNKTIIGANVLPDPATMGSGSGFTGGGLLVSSVSNVVIRNLVLSMPNSDDDSNSVDAIRIETSTQVWVDHCDVSSNGPSADGGASYDGLIDITDGSDFVTISWTHYHDHADTGILGRSDTTSAESGDAGKNHVTFDHDWYTNISEGPRLRFGTVHVLNTFFDGAANYAVASIDGANVRIEASYFKGVSQTKANANFGPVTTFLDGALIAGNVDLLANNTTVASGSNNLTTPNVPFALPYPYTPDSADNVPALAQACAGTGKIAAPTGN